MFGFLCGFETKLLLHFIDIHRYISPANTIDYLCIRILRKLRAFAIGAFLFSSCPSCTWLSHAPTTMPLPTPHVALEFRWALACLLPTLLRIHREVSRVRHVGLKQNDLGGVLSIPRPLSAAPSCGYWVRQVYQYNLLQIQTPQSVSVRTPLLGFGLHELTH